MSATIEENPIYRTQLAREILCETMYQLRNDVRSVSDERARALFENSVEVLGGLIAQFDVYEKQQDGRWRG